MRPSTSRCESDCREMGCWHRPCMDQDSVVLEGTSTTDRSVGRPGSRRLPRLAAGAGGVLSVYALPGFLLVPRLARWAIQEKGRAALHREVTLREVRFNPFTFDLNLSGLRIRDRDLQPLFSLDHLHLELALSGILKRTWRVSELRIDRPYVELRVLRDGKLSVADLLTA